MKNLYTFLVMLLATAFLHAQNGFNTSFDFTTFPAEWSQQTSASDGGWKLFNPYASNVVDAGWPAPGGDWQYAYTSDAVCQCDKSSDVLILPGTYSSAKNWSLVFDYYFPGTNANVSGEQASVVYSLDGGSTWISLLELDPAGKAWQSATTGLKTANFLSPVQFGIRYTDNGGLGTGFAIDNIFVVPTDKGNLHITGKVQSDAPIFVGQEVMVQATVTNLGDEDIYGVELSIQMPGQQPYTEVIEEIELPAMSSFTFDYPISVSAAGLGTFSMGITPLGLSDPMMDDNSFDVQIASVNAGSIQHGIVGEEATGTWCGWCPRGAVFMDLMANKYPDFIGIAVHNGDPMVNQSYDQWMANSVGGYPSAHIQRKYKDFNPSALEANYLLAKQDAPPAELALDIDYDETTKMLNATVSANFLINAVSHRFNLVITEDGVTGSGAGWSQANYYAGGGQGPMGGYENLPNPVPASQMVYDHVARAIVGSPNGAVGSLPFIVKAGELHSYEFQFQLDPTWDPEKIHVIGFLHNDQNKQIVNAISTSLLSSSNQDLPASVQTLDIFPNPATTDVAIRLTLDQAQPVQVRILDMLGTTMAERNYGMQQGDQILPVIVSDWPSGIYQLMITVGGQSVSRPLVVNNR